VTIPDFELRGRLRASALTTHAPPATRLESTAVRLERLEARVGLPPRTEAGKGYVNVVVDRRVLGELDVEH
jgi:hypothetical protein